MDDDTPEIATPAPAPAPEADKEPAQSPITYDELWTFCAALESDRARWLTTLNDKPSPTIERQREMCLRLCNMIRLFELYERDFMTVVKLGGLPGRRKG